MKLHRLELQGFGPFLERQVVDFDAFADDGIFLISGRTGAGKSSILDGVAFALYGSVPRYEGGDRRIRSDHAEPDDATEVVLEFTAVDRRFTVTRSPDYEKPKKRGDGLTPVPHAAQLDEFVHGKWITLAAKPREVGNLLGEILGLTQQQFLQVILLAQNRFAQFLLAKNDERQALLRTLFGSRAYGDYQAALDQRRKQSEQNLARGGAEVRLLLDEADLLVDEHELGGDHLAADAGSAAQPDPARLNPAQTTPARTAPDVSARIAWVERAVERADYRRDTLGRDRDAAEDAHAAAGAAHAALTALRAQQAQRATSRAALADLEADEPRVAVERTRLERAAAAESLRSSIDASVRARAAAANSAATQIAAMRAWADAGEDSEADATVIRARIEAMTSDLGRWSAAIEQERELMSLADLLDAERGDEQALTARVAELDARRLAFPDRLATIDLELVPLADSAVEVETARNTAAEVAARLSAARDAASKADAMTIADRLHLERSSALEEAASLVTGLLRRRLSGYAGELAAQLVTGEPCAVCGSREHPGPAAHSDEPVTEEEITAAEAGRDRAADAEREASSAARAARTAHAEAAGRSGGEGIDTLEAAALAATEAKGAAEAAESRRVTLTAQRTAVVAEEQAARADLADAQVRLAETRNSLAVIEERANTARTAVDRARGDFATVADRAAAITRLRECARSLAVALEDADLRAARVAEADADLDARIAASEFDDTAAVVAALLDAATRSESARLVREHEVVLRAERDRLRDLELELAGQPDELVDLEASAAAIGLTRVALRAATEAATRATAAAERLRALAARARAAHVASAELEVEHEIIAGLAMALSGRTASRMDLETFVLAAELEEIIAAANLRLSSMSSGRYLLKHTDAVAARNAASGLGIEIVDAYTGRTRPAHSLSGGETFLASLALALGLAEVVTARAGGLRLDTLFIDEGFGSLDAETLELAMSTLDELRQGGRTVGVISHVDAMKEQLPAQLSVTASPQGPSTIHQAAIASV